MGPGIVRGLVAPFHRVGHNARGFYTIEPGAFDGLLDRRIPAIVNHDPKIFLGDTRSGSLRLWLDAAGLNAELVLPGNDFGRWARDETFACSLKGWSFSYRDCWGDRLDLSGGRSVVVVRKFDRLSEVSLAHHPAFPGTTLSWRPTTVV